MVNLTGQFSKTDQNAKDRSNDRSWPVRFETLFEEYLPAFTKSDSRDLLIHFWHWHSDTVQNNVLISTELIDMNEIALI